MSKYTKKCYHKFEYFVSMESEERILMRCKKCHEIRFATITIIDKIFGDFK